MKQFGLFSLIFLLYVSILSAGSFENFKYSQSSDFKKFKDERDTAFTSYLRSEWKVYQEQVTKSIYKKPKPKTLPSTTSKPIEKVGPKVNIIIKKIKQEKIVKKIKNLDKNTNLSFFGSSFNFDVSSDISSANYFPRNQNGITSFFDKMASSDYEELVSDIQKIKKDFNLNDWATYLLVLELSKTIYTEDDNAKLFSWFIFNKLGYAVKVGLVDKHVILLHYSKKMIYSTPNYTFSKKKFYALSYYNKGSVGRVYTYSKNYPGSDNPLDLSLKTLPNFALNKENKNLSFIDNGKEINIEFTYNKNLIDFMGTYPQANYETYFNSPLENDTNIQILNGLKKHINGKKISEAMNFVLHFVQKSFRYEVDNKQFSREKVMFAQETLYFNKSDCEDRAVLFSYLIKELFGVNVIGVKYSDHMATALYIPMEGDSVKSGAKRYVIADPTYINANIGQSMLEYKSKRPESFILMN